jgi:hypothetical protein
MCGMTRCLGHRVVPPGFSRASYGIQGKRFARRDITDSLLPPTTAATAAQGGAKDGNLLKMQRERPRSLLRMRRSRLLERGPRDMHRVHGTQ